MNTITRVKSNEEWKALIDEHEKSGLTQIKFCAQKNISPGKFGYYRSLLLIKDKPEIKAQSLFTPIQIKKPDAILADIRLILPNGFECYLPSNIAPAQIKQLIGVLLSC